MSLVLTDVHKSFGDTVVLDGVSLEFPMGKTTAIIGPSGTGKSVLVKHLVGLLRPDAGTIECFGVDVGRARHKELMKLRKRFGMLFQDGALFDSMTVGENIDFPLAHNTGLSRAERKDRVAEVLEQVELPGFEDRRIAELSGGQRKRVGLARAIATHPFTSDAIDALIGSMKERLGITFIVITHDIVGTLNVADTIGMLYEGKLIAFGPTEQLLKNPHPVLRRFLARNVPEMRP